MSCSPNCPGHNLVRHLADFFQSRDGVPDNTLCRTTLTEGFPTRFDLARCQQRVTWTAHLHRRSNDDQPISQMNLCVATRPRCVKANTLLVKRAPTTESPLVTMGVLGSPLGIMTKVFEARLCPGKAYSSVVLTRVMDPAVGDRQVSKGKGSHQSGLPSGRQGQGARGIIPVGLTAKGLPVQIGSHGLINLGYPWLIAK